MDVMTPEFESDCRALLDREFSAALKNLRSSQNVAFVER